MKGLEKMARGRLFHASCLDVLERLEDAKASLVYLDPPWDSAAFKIRPEDEAKSGDWEAHLSKIFQQARRLLREDGSLFIHTQPAQSPYIKILLDGILGPENFREEFIIPSRGWRGTKTSGGPQHATILFYSKTGHVKCTPPRRRLSERELIERYTHSDSQGRYRLTSLFRPSGSRGLNFVWQDIQPPVGREWMYSAANLEDLHRNDQIYFSKGMPFRKQYAGDASDAAVGTVWDDIVPLVRGAVYPNQQSLAILERIITMATDPGELIIDPMCGSGTSLVAAQTLSRDWVGCDISTDAINTTQERLQHECELEARQDYRLLDSQDVANLPIVSKFYHSIDIRRIQKPSGYLLHSLLEAEEDRNTEYKEVRSKNPVDSICKTSEIYAVAFLNREGGRIFWGIDDDGKVVGVHLDRSKRDDLRQVVTNKLADIRPPIPVSSFSIKFHPVLTEAAEIKDLVVVELVIPKPEGVALYFTGGGDAYIRTDAGKKELKGLLLQAEILHRFSS